MCKQCAEQFYRPAIIDWAGHAVATLKIGAGKVELDDRIGRPMLQRSFERRNGCFESVTLDKVGAALDLEPLRIIAFRAQPTGNPSLCFQQGSRAVECRLRSSPA